MRLSEGADIETRDPQHRRTLLSLAAAYGHEAIVKHLLEKGADMEHKDIEGRKAIWLAMVNGHEDVVKTLLERGADIEPEREPESTFGTNPY
ncbi:ankyrin [Thozetella sp. PMI_491]|nr:ankyrin [Thozetella sp. PMI_491]